MLKIFATTCAECSSFYPKICKTLPRYLGCLLMLSFKNNPGTQQKTTEASA